MGTVVLGKLKVVYGSDTSELDKGAQQAKDKMDDVQKKSGSMTAAIRSNIAAASLAIVAAMTAAAAAVKSTVDGVIELRNASESIGANVGKFSELAFAARSNGIAVEALTVSMIKLSQHMSEKAWDQLAEGNRLFAALGISARDATGKMRDSTDVLLDIANRFARMQDGAEKTALAMRLFGEQGVRLLPMLNQGADGIKRFVDEAKNMGATLDKDAVAAFETMNNMLSKATALFNVLMQQVVKNLMPAFQAIEALWNSNSLAMGGLGRATDDLSVVMKGLISIGVIIQQTFTNVYATIRTIVAAVYQMATGEFSKAWDTIKEGAMSVWNTSAATGTALVGIWQGWTTTVERTAADFREKTVAPTVKSIEDITNAMNDWRVGQRNAFDEMMNDPTASMAQKMEVLEEMTRRNIVTWREFGQTMKTLKDQNRQHMNDMLSLTGQVLTTMFNKSKAAAAASALINTYQGITKAIAEYPPPISYAMAGLQAALGFAQVRQIYAASASGGGGGGATSVPSAPPVAAAAGSQGGASGPSNTLFVQGFSADGFFSGDAVRSLAEKLLEYQRNGGTVVLA